MVEHDCGVQTSTSRDLCQVKHAWKRGTIVIMAITYIEMSLLVENVLRVLVSLLGVDVRHDTLQMLDIVFAVKRAHLVD